MTRKRWIKLLMSRYDIDRDAARALADYVAEQNASISQLNKTLKKRDKKYRVPTIRYTGSLKPVLSARMWEEGARVVTERMAYR